MLDIIAKVLLAVGGLNWALVGIFKFDLVATITGAEFGQTNAMSRIVYILVGASAVWVLARLFSGREHAVAGRPVHAR